MLTNFDTIKKRLQHFRELAEKQKTDDFQQLSKKEQRDIIQELAKLSKRWEGVKDLTEMPAALFLLDVPDNTLAVKEAKKMGVKVIALCDTDANITDIDYPIPANDDALPAVKYLLERVLKAITTARRKQKDKQEN